MKLYYKIVFRYLYRQFRHYKQHYFVKKSSRLTRNRSLYLYDAFGRKPTIRVSNHYLHPTQERFRQIDLVIIDTDNITINKKPVYFDKTAFKQKHLKAICYEYILLELNLYKLLKRKH